MYPAPTAAPPHAVPHADRYLSVAFLKALSTGYALQQPGHPKHSKRLENAHRHSSYTTGFQCGSGDVLRCLSSGSMLSKAKFFLPMLRKPVRKTSTSNEAFTQQWRTETKEGALRTKCSWSKKMNIAQKWQQVIMIRLSLLIMYNFQNKRLETWETPCAINQFYSTVFTQKSLQVFEYLIDVYNIHSPKD